MLEVVRTGDRYVCMYTIGNTNLYAAVNFQVLLNFGFLMKIINNRIYYFETVVNLF